MKDPGLRQVELVRRGAPETDTLAVEEPLEIHVEDQPLVVLMRTPGEDLDLAAGFLWTDGIIDGPDDLGGLAPCVDPNRAHAENIVKVRLASGVPRPQARAHYATAGCGLCGKTAIDELFQRITPLPTRRRIPTERVDQLVRALRPHQPRFAATGGLHGAALFDQDDALLWAREDIGRHNAVDKVLGAALRADRLALRETTLVVSSRAGFEIIQKALVAGVGAVIAVGAASTLAHELAQAGNLALYSFARGEGANEHR